VKLLTKEQSRELDNIAINKMGIPGADLMGKAGSFIAEYAKNMVEHFDNPSIAVICGKGNNAGDGYKAALDLYAEKYKVKIFNLFSSDSIVGDSKIYFDKCIDKKITIEEMDYDSDEYDLIIDAILGTGYKGELKNPIADATKWINSKNALVLAVDIPSGVNANNGFIAEHAVKADVTVTMGLTKVGMTIQPAKSFCGDIIPVDIGFPDIYSELPGGKFRLTDEDLAFEYLKAPDLATYKHKQGKVLILAGSQGMTGATILASNAAIRSGAGLVTTFAPRSLSNIYESNIIEGLTVVCEDNGLGHFTEKNYAVIESYFDWADSLLIGPGLGTENETVELVNKVITNFDKPLVIDADGLALFAGNKKNFDLIKSEYAITPHFGELAKLLDIEILELKNDIVKIFEELNKDIHGTIVAKNAPTYILNNETIIVNTTGNQGMATGGTGDVLSGIIASFIAQGIPTPVASEIGVYIHGKAADAVKNDKGFRGLIASDIIQYLPGIIKTYE